MLIKLKTVIRKEVIYDSIPIAQDSAIVVDMIALVNTMSNQGKTYAEFAESFIQRIPKGYKRVDIIADTYKEGSIKCSEQNIRGE